MKRKIEIIESCEAMLAGGRMTADMRARYPRWNVVSVLATGYDSLLASQYQQYRKGIFNKDQFSLDNYSVIFSPTTTPPVVIQQDTVRGDYYCVLPKPVIQLPDNEGIRWIAPVGNEAGAGVPVTQVASIIRSSLVVSEINPRFTFKLERDTIRLNFPIVPITNLMMSLVVPFDDLEDNDLVDEPSIMSKNGLYTIYDYAKQNLLAMPITKQTENNDPNE